MNFSMEPGHLGFLSNLELVVKDRNKRSAHVVSQSLCNVTSTCRSQSMYFFKKLSQQ